MFRLKLALAVYETEEVFEPPTVTVMGWVPPPQLRKSRQHPTMSRKECIDILQLRVANNRPNALIRVGNGIDKSTPVRSPDIRRA